MWVCGYPVLPKPRPAETRHFVLKARRPKFGRLYTDLAYRPMVELLAYLGADGFTTWICSGGRQDFVAAVSYEMYVFPPDQVIGSTLKKEEVEKCGKRVTWRFPEVTSANDKAEKVVSIQKRISKRPAFCAGNVRSAGDVAMLDSRRREGPSFQLLINHDDPEREFAYQKEDNASLDAAKKQGWAIVSMKSDWKVIFPPAGSRDKCPCGCPCGTDRNTRRPTSDFWTSWDGRVARTRPDEIRGDRSGYQREQVGYVAEMSGPRDHWHPGMCVERARRRSAGTGGAKVRRTAAGAGEGGCKTCVATGVGRRREGIRDPSAEHTSWEGDLILAHSAVVIIGEGCRCLAFRPGMILMIKMLLGLPLVLPGYRIARPKLAALPDSSHGSRG